MIRDRGAWLCGVRDSEPGSEFRLCTALGISSLALSVLIYTWSVSSEVKPFPAGPFYDATLLVNVLGTLESAPGTLSTQ